MQFINTDRKAVLAALALLTLYLSPLFILGESSHIRVHDNLDSNIAWYKVLIQSGEWFGPIEAVIPQIMNGISRNSFGTEFSGIVLLHALFPSMLAYALSQLIARAFAFLGMYLLLRDHFVKEAHLGWIRAGAALAFALTPFWPSGMLSTLGQPLALWAFLHIRRGQGRPKHWISLLLLPLYSSFVLGFFFFLAAIAALWLWDAVRKRRLNLTFLGSILAMLGMYLLVEYRLLHSLVFSTEPTSRSEFFSSRLDTWQSVRLALKNFILGHNHVMTLHTAVMLPMMLIVLYLILSRHRLRSDPHARAFLILFALSFGLSVWYAFWFHAGWQPLKERISLLNTFNFARFHFLRPIILYLGFVIGCRLLWMKGGRTGRTLACTALAAQIVILFGYHDEILYRYEKKPSFGEFYAVEQFRLIGEYIGKPKAEYRVASIGLHPAIAQYNGFYTLDSYNNFYSLKYKHEFRKIIRKELKKNRKLKTYFDTWGGRCYLFVAELGKKYDFRKDSRKKIRNLELDMKAFKRMGGRYIFSALPIVDAERRGLTLLHVFEHADSAWKVHLYEAK
jgi:hypothetical protein